MARLPERLPAASSMFGDLIADHQKRKAACQEAVGLSCKSAVEAAPAAAACLVDACNEHVRQLFLKESEIGRMRNSLAATVDAFAQQHQQWSKLFKEMDDAIKEVGDFENWMAVMEKDLQVVAATLNIVADAPHV